ncbi:hypothetical protein BZG36_02566 [Bifiguratus adelaidae]|uniref:Homoaconitase, mitochondrial n=1 Tax=Bifiguratus adelaidae TaxID=1938954 RepID=A0A261Y103_9FUNG|nr:hypothetical protein BZG36_02566 [Bifiguratus adelaidae]
MLRALPRVLEGSRSVQTAYMLQHYARSRYIGFRLASTQAENSTQNLVEKIVQKYAVDVEGLVKSGDYVSIRPHHVLTHDNTGAVMPKFRAIGATKFKNPKQPVFALDHDVQNKSEKNLTKYANIEKFAKQHGIDFYPAGRGIGHQVMVEEGYAFPGTLTVASDSHSNMYGGIGCLGTPIVRTDAAAIWATGRTWWQIPPVVKVELKGSLPAGVTGKDVIITLCGLFNKDEVLNSAIEFHGTKEAMHSIPLEDRLAIANMTTEWGALAGLFPVDELTIDWLKSRMQRLKFSSLSNSNIPPTPKGQAFEHPRINETTIQELIDNPLTAGKDAQYAKHLVLDLSTLSPHVSGPNSVKVSRSLADLQKEDIAINKAYLVSCVNSRASDIRAAASVMKGKSVAPNVQFYVAAASSEVQREVEESGDWDVLVQAGAKVLPAGCGPCVGLGTGLLEDGEVGISATNRNFKGRMGSPKALAYLASPAPLPNFPAQITGEILFCPQDNLNTDGIYPGKYTYQDDLKPDEMRKVVMENYDPSFAGIVKESDILVGGYNFGTGSSREQAATALKSCGIPLTLAGSFSDIFKRNSINNALLVAECRALLEDLKREFASGALTKRTGWIAEADVTKGTLTVWTGGEKGKGEKKEYGVGRLGRSVQELWLAQGLEGWVKERL